MKAFASFTSESSFGRRLMIMQIKMGKKFQLSKYQNIMKNNRSLQNKQLQTKPTQEKEKKKRERNINSYKQVRDVICGVKA